MALTLASNAITFTDSTSLSSGIIGTAQLSASSITTEKLSAGAVTTTTIANSAVTAAKMSGGQTGSAPVYGCRAWVNFDGTGTIGTNQTVRASGNVSSVYKNGTGDYTVNFTVPMQDSFYSILATGCGGDATSVNTSIGIYGTNALQLNNQVSLSSTGVRVLQQIANGTNTDSDSIHICVFR